MMEKLEKILKNLKVKIEDPEKSIKKYEKGLKESYIESKYISYVKACSCTKCGKC